MLQAFTEQKEIPVTKMTYMCLDFLSYCSVTCLIGCK